MKQIYLTIIIAILSMLPAISSAQDVDVCGMLNRLVFGDTVAVTEHSCEDDYYNYFNLRNGDQLFFNEFDFDGYWIKDYKLELQLDTMFTSEYVQYSMIPAQNIRFPILSKVRVDTSQNISVSGWVQNIDYAKVFLTEFPTDSIWLIADPVPFYSFKYAQFRGVVPQNTFSVEDTVYGISYFAVWDTLNPDPLPISYTEWSSFFGLTHYFDAEGGSQHRLKGAIVSGRVYGDTSLVSITNISTGNDLPKRIILAQNYPNPFNPSTNINFTIPQKGLVSLIVYDVLGREVATLVNGTLPAGKQSIRFDASTLANGMYLYKLRVNNQEIVRKMTLIK